MIYNTVTLVGNVVNDTEIVEYGDGRSLSKFSLAVKRRSRDGQEPLTDFFDIVYFKKALLKRGDRVVIDGELRQEKWENREGEKRSKVTVVAFSILPLERRAADGTQTTNKPKNEKAKRQNRPDEVEGAEPSLVGSDEGDEDIPF